MIDIVTALVDHLVSNDFGLEGQSLFAGALPDRPDRCTAVMQTGGPSVSGNPTKRPEITILHRDTRVQDSTVVMGKLHKFLTSNNGFHCTRLGVTGRFTTISEPGAAGYDANRRLVYQVRYTFVTIQNP